MEQIISIFFILDGVYTHYFSMVQSTL